MGIKNKKIEIGEFLEGMDILGRKVRELKVEGGKVGLDRGNLETGLYLIRVLGSGKVLVE
ncbi:MAG: hypothetical protein ACPGVB_11050 [Chitinophagales bacterium]